MNAVLWVQQSKLFDEPALRVGDRGDKVHLQHYLCVDAVVGRRERNDVTEILGDLYTKGIYLPRISVSNVLGRDPQLANLVCLRSAPWISRVPRP